MNQVKDALSVSPQYLEQDPVYVLLRGGMIVGFFGFLSQPSETLLNDFWLEPEVIGTGVGRVMWEHAVRHARANGCRAFAIHSDPNAEGFYLHMGARRIGTRIALETGRELPLLEYDVLPERHESTSQTIV